MHRTESGLILREWIDTNREFAEIYQSSSFSVFYAEAGRVTLSINGDPLSISAGSGMLLGTGQFYQLKEVDEDARLLMLQVDPYTLFAPDLARHYVTPYAGPSGGHVLLRPLDRSQAMMLKTIDKAFRHARATGAFAWMDATLQLAVVWRYWIQNRPDTSPMRHGMERLQDMLAFIEGHLHEKVTLAQIAAAGKISRSECCRTFASLTGASPLAYTQELKMERAATVLLETDESVADVAKRFGFTSVSHFVQSFKKYHGQTPLAYKKKTT